MLKYHILDKYSYVEKTSTMRQSSPEVNTLTNHLPSEGRVLLIVYQIQIF